MRAGRRVLIALGALVALILLVLILVPLLFEDRIAARAQAEIEQAVEADVYWSDTGLSFFRDFPHLTLTLQDLSVSGVDRFEGDTLAIVPGFRLVLDVGSVLFGDQIVVRSIDVDRPSLRLIVLEDGTANWDIVRAAEGDAAAAPEGGGLNLGLRALNVTDGRVAFDNRQAGVSALIENLDHSLRGDFTRDRFGIAARALAEAVTVRFGGVPYLDGVELQVAADVDADLTEGRFTFRDNEVRLNDLVLAFTGSATAPEDDEAVGLNVEFESQRSDFRSVLSLVPAIWARDFESLRTEGEVAVRGRIEGRYGEDAFPSFELLANVDSASFQYPDLPLPARDIFVQLSVDNPGGDLDSTVVNLRRFHARIGQDAIAGTMTVRTPVSDPEIDLAVNGTLDLGAVSRTFKLEGVRELAGTVNADVLVHARQSALVAEQYDRVSASGDIVASNVILQADSLPHRVALDELTLGISPRVAELRTLRGTVGSSDVRMRGTLENLLAFAMTDDAVLQGTATLQSDRFDLDEWRSRDSELAVVLVPPRVEFTLRTDVAQLHLGQLDMTAARGVVRVQNERLTIDTLTLNAVGGQFRLAGYYETTDPARPTFDIDMSIANADMAESFAALTTVQAFAPVARYAQGRFSTNLSLVGALGEGMTPILTALTGRGALETSQVVLESFPPLQRLADALSSQRLRNPALRAISTVIDIREGRLHVRPFDFAVGPMSLTAGGSNGIDRSLDYDIVIAMPPSALESGARQAVSDLFARAGAGALSDTMSLVRIAVQLGGTVTDPSISLDVGRGVQTAVQSLEQAAQESVERATQAVEERVDSATLQARRQAEAEAQRLVEEAQQRADVIREEARELAEGIRRRANEQADSLVARASSPVARIAAERAAERLRSEADERATEITSEADARADALVAEARRQGEALVRAAGGAPIDTLARDTARN